MMTPALRRVLDRRGLLGSALDLNFENARYFQQGVGSDIDKLITCSRASTGYADSAAGDWASFGSNVPRITNKGLFIEEARTNSIRNNSMQGAIAGSPGTLPTNWSIINVGTLTSSVIGVGTQNGIDYIDVRLNGTASGNGTSYWHEPVGVVAASTGQVWGQSAFFAIVGGSLTNITAIQTSNWELTSGGAFIRANVLNCAISSALTRYTAIHTLSGGATTAFIRPYTFIGTTNGAAIDITLRIGWPQLELGAFVTSPIRTTNAAVTRAADIVTVTSPLTFGSAYSLFGKGTPNASAAFLSNQTVAGASDGTTNNRIIGYRRGSGGTGNFKDTRGLVSAGAANIFDNGPTSVWNINTSGKVAVAYRVNNQAMCFNGGSVVSGSSASVPSAFTAVQIGNSGAGGALFNGYVERVALWPNIRLSDSDLQRITAP